MAKNPDILDRCSLAQCVRGLERVVRQMEIEGENAADEMRGAMGEPDPEWAFRYAVQAAKLYSDFVSYIQMLNAHFDATGETEAS
jgi:hypothetical protein